MLARAGSALTLNIAKPKSAAAGKEKKRRHEAKDAAAGERAARIGECPEKKSMACAAKRCA
jgi:hypothetical protein